MSHTHPQTTSPAAFGNWWALALRGVAAILFGLVALLWPGLTLAALILVFGAYAVIDGASAVVAGVREGNGTRRWLLIAEGAFSILAGLVALFWPDITAIALLYLFAFWAIFGGLVRIVGAVLLRRELDNEWTMALSGVLSVLLGVILATIPGAGLLSLAWLIGVFALGVGLTLLAMAFRMRSSQNNDSDRVA